MNSASLFRRALVGLIGMAISAPFVIWASQECMKGLSNSPVLWVSPEYEPRRQYDEFLKRFDRPEAVVISWPGCSIDDPRLSELSSELCSDKPLPDGGTYRDLFPNVFNGYDAVRGLTAEPLELRRETAIRRLMGTLVGKDGESSCAIVLVSLEGAYQRRLVLELILEAAERTIELPRDEFRLSGSLIDGVAIDDESLNSNKFVIPSAIISLLICLYCMRSLSLAAPVFLVAAFGEGLVLAIAYAVGAEMNAVLLVLSPLVFILTISSGVHFANYYRDEVLERGPEGAVTRALKVGFLPCALAAFTTAIGLASLIVSDAIPVKHFGQLGAAGILSTFALMFLVMPGVLVWRPLKVTPQLRASAKGMDLTWLARAVDRFAPLWVLASFAILAVGAWGLTYVRTSINVLTLLEPGSRLVRDYTWLEENLGPLVPLEIVVEFDEDCEMNTLQKLEMLTAVHVSASRVEGVGGTLSAVSFLPGIPRQGGLRGTVRRRVYEKTVNREMQSLVDAGYVATSNGEEAWRVITRTSSLNDEDYGIFLQGVESAVDEQLAKFRDAGRTGFRVSYTGVVPLVYAGQNMLLKDLINSFSTAFLVVAIVMVLTLRSVTAGLVAMIPNLFPVVILFGTMGWLNQPVDIGSMMTASIALGIAVDGTLHFLLWYRRSRLADQTASDAMSSAMCHCGRAMLHSTLICSLGLVVFAFSGFIPTQRFAWMMCALLGAALFGDLIMLPALLVGPLRHLRIANSSTKPQEPVAETVVKEEEIPIHDEPVEDDEEERGQVTISSSAVR